MEKVYICTTGCHRRYLDSQRIFNYLKVNGYEIVKNPKKSDYILFNTCAFKKEEEEFCLKKIQKLKRYGKKIIIGGCLPAINEKKLREIFTGPVFTPASINNIDEFFNSKIKFKDIADANFLLDKICSTDNKPFIKNIFQFNYKFLEFFFDRAKGIIEKNYFVRISQGCLGNCTFCGIKKAIGLLKSKSLEECVEEFKKGISLGYKNIIILGDDTGAYGLDINQTFPNLLEKFIKIEGNYKIYIFDFNPRWVIKYLEQLIPIIKSKKIFEIFCPVQSGSDKILTLMQRLHTVQEIKNALLTIKKTFPEIRIIGQFIIGFPGETEEDFEKTLNFIKEVGFTYTIPYPFFERPNTLACQLPNKVSPEIIKKRMAKIKKFLARV